MADAGSLERTRHARKRNGIVFREQALAGCRRNFSDGQSITKTLTTL
jgi:hypothetical protein